MVGISELKIMNYTTIKLLENLKQNTKRNRIISKILKDEACFFKMDKQDAFDILKQIGVSESRVGKVYSDLISEQYFYKLKNKGKITDEECVIFDNNFNNDIFQKNEEKSNENRAEVQMVVYKESKLQRIINKLKSIFKKNK